MSWKMYLSRFRIIENFQRIVTNPWRTCLQVTPLTYFARVRGFPPAPNAKHCSWQGESRLATITRKIWQPFCMFPTIDNNGRTQLQLRKPRRQLRRGTWPQGVEQAPDLKSGASPPPADVIYHDGWCNGMLENAWQRPGKGTFLTCHLAVAMAITNERRSWTGCDFPIAARPGGLRFPDHSRLFFFFLRREAWTSEGRFECRNCACAKLCWVKFYNGVSYFRFGVRHPRWRSWNGERIRRRQQPWTCWTSNKNSSLRVAFAGRR